MTDDVEVKFGASTGDAEGGIDSLVGKLGEIGESVEGFKASIAGLGETFAAAFAVDELEEFASEMANIGLQLENMTHLTGMSTDAVQDFQDSIQILGGNADDVGTTLVRLERNISDASAGVGESAQAFKRLGVSMSALKSGDVNTVLEQMSDRMHDTADDANKMSAAMEAGGRGAYQLVPFLDQGSEGFKNLIEAIDEAKVKLSPELAEAFAESAVGMNIMHQASEGLSEQIYAQLEPAFDAIVAGMTKFDANGAKNIQSGNGLAKVLQFLGAVIDGVANVVMGLGMIFEGVFDSARGIVNSLIDLFQGLGQAITDVMHGQLQKGVDDYHAAVQRSNAALADGFQKAAQDRDEYLEETARMLDVYSGNASVSPIKLGNTQGSGHIAPNPKVDDSDAESKDRSLYEKQYQVKKEYDDLMVQSGQMTHQQEFTDLQEALQKEQAAIDQSFDQQMALYSEDSKQYKQLNDEKQIADQQFYIQHLKLIDDMTKQESKGWTDAFNAIQKGFDTMLQGVLQGTQTWQQALQHVFSNMVLSFASAVAEMLVKYAAFQIATNAGFTKIASGIAGASGGADAGGVMTKLATAMLSLVGIETVSATGTDANTLALGTLTAAVTANTTALTISDATHIPGFAVGTPFVPNDMVARIHKGERIVPAADNKAISNGEASLGGGAGGDTHVHLNVSAFDAADVQSMFSRHSDKISKALVAATRGGNTSLKSAMARM